MEDVGTSAIPKIVAQGGEFRKVFVSFSVCLTCEPLRFTLAGKMSKEIPSWLKESGSIVQKKNDQRIQAQITRGHQEALIEQREEEKRLIDTNRLEKEGLWAINKWREMDLDAVSEGVFILFEKAKLGPLRITSPSIKFSGPNDRSETAFETDDYLQNKQPYKPLKDYIHDFIRHGTGYGTTYQQGDRLKDTHFDSISQKIRRIWWTTEGHSGEGEHSYQQEHSEDFFVIRLQTEGIFISMPEGKNNHPFVKLVSFENQQSADDVKGAVDKFVSEFV